MLYDDDDGAPAACADASRQAPSGRRQPAASQPASAVVCRRRRQRQAGQPSIKRQRAALLLPPSRRFRQHCRAVCCLPSPSPPAAPCLSLSAIDLVWFAAAARQASPVRQPTLMLTRRRRRPLLAAAAAALSLLPLCRPPAVLPSFCCRFSSFSPLASFRLRRLFKSARRQRRQALRAQAPSSPVVGTPSCQALAVAPPVRPGRPRSSGPFAPSSGPSVPNLTSR